MKLSAQISFWFALAFAAFCLAYALFGFTSVEAGADPDVVANSRGYAWFWTFLGVVGLAIALVSHRMVKTQPRDDR
jgi:dipeptide/tripeptide permease